MSRFFFDLCQDDAVIRPDDVGSELDSSSDAIKEALVSLAELAMDDVQHGTVAQKISIQIRDERSTQIATVDAQFAG